MQTNERENDELFTIDLLYVFRTLMQKAWLIILTTVLAGCIGFGISAHVMKPDYSATVLLYVNNTSFNVGNASFSISASDISASQSLVKTYTELLKNRTTLEKVIEKAQVNYTYKQLFDMVKAGPSNNTEVMYVTVTRKDPFVAAKLANSVAQILPERITEIIDGASMEVVDYAVPNTQKVSPNITKNTALAAILGFAVIVMIFSVMAVMDDTIHSEDYIIEAYDYPILAKVPDLMLRKTDDGSYRNKHTYGEKKQERR